ncbi:MAG: hypothetical protein EXS25_08995 [Pedosphaera sp.]|nr:hypothetical protein [Pedosphaera sp.]
MNLPNLFLADLGPDLELTPNLLRDACSALRRNREEWLGRQRIRDVIEMIAFTADQWLDPSNEFRSLAIQKGPASTGFGAATLVRGLDSFFRQLSVANLESLVIQDLGDLRRLDAFTSGTSEQHAGKTSIANGPELLVHFTAGNLPNPALFSMVLGLLTRSAQVIKCPVQASLLPRLFAHSLSATESKLGASLELVSWSRSIRGSIDLENMLLSEANCVTTTGGDELIVEMRRRVPISTRFVGYGHKLSFGFVAKETLNHYSVKRVIRGAVDDITAWNQSGCLSPHVFYIEDEGEGAATRFASELAEELHCREVIEPRGEVSLEESTEIVARRGAYQLRSIGAVTQLERSQVRTPFFEHVPRCQVWSSEGSTNWTVVLDGDPRFKASCLNRFIYVKPVARFEDILRYAEPVRQQISTVGLAVQDDRLHSISTQLARWGVSRICPIGRMQAPPVGWRHDGRPALGDLVTWTDLES